MSPDTDAVLLVPNPSDAEQVLSALARQGLDGERVTTVASEDEFTVVTAAAVAAALGVPSMSVDTAIALRDKYVQKKLIVRAGLATARCHVIDALGELNAVPIQLPFVVKPLAGAAARDTHAVMDATTLRDLADGEDPAAPPSGPWLVESFTPGIELHLDGVVRDGELTALGVSRYLQNILSIRSGGLVGSVTLAPERHPSLYQTAHRHVEAALRALGHRDGIFHLEAFLDEDRLTFSECAGRSGGGMVREAMSEKFGVSLADEWARAVLRTAPGRPAATAPEAIGFVNLPAAAGTVESLPSEDDVRARPGVREVRLGVALGDVMPDVSSSSFAKAGVALVAGPDEQVAEERLRDLAAWFSRSVRVRSAMPAAAYAAPDPVSA